MKKSILIPSIFLAGLIPVISITSCNPNLNTINVNLNAGRDWHLESSPFSLEKDKEYILSFDFSNWTQTMMSDAGRRLVSFSNQYIPNVTSFVFNDHIYNKVNDISEIGQHVYNYFVGTYNDNHGIFFFVPYLEQNHEFNIKFKSNIEEANIVVELNRSSW